MPERTAEELLTKSIDVTRHYASLGPAWIAERISARDWDPTLLIDVLALALIKLAEPGRVRQLDDLAGELAEALYDNAHEGCGCDDAGCTGGGLPHYRELVDQVLMPVVREHAVPEAVDA